MYRLLKALKSHEGGATAIEYALILAMIVLAMMVALAAVADGTKGKWQEVANKVKNA